MQDSCDETKMSSEAHVGRRKKKGGSGRKPQHTQAKESKQKTRKARGAFFGRGVCEERGAWFLRREG
jgi:hypothetical protein